MKIRIIKEWDDHEPVVLGIVEANELYLSGADAKKAVDDAWVSFQATEPESDTEFIDFLVRLMNFRKVQDDAIDMVIG